MYVRDVIRWLDRHGKPDGTVFAEHEPAEIKKFQRAGWPVEQAETSIDPGIAEVRRRLDSDGNMEVAQGHDVPSVWYDPSHRDRTAADAREPEHGSRVGLLVADTCQHLVREFLGYKEEHVGTGAATDHALDALRYAVMGASRREQRSRDPDRPFARTF